MVDEPQAAHADHAGHRAAGAQQDEGQELDAHGVDAVEPGRALVDAHRLDVEPQGGEAKQQGEEDAHQDDDQNRRRDRDAGDEAAQRVEDGAGHRGRRAAVDPVGDAAAAGEEDQRRDHGLDLKERHQRTVERAEGHGHRAAGEERAEHREDGDVAAALEDLHEDAARDGSEGAHRNILSAGGRGHQRHAHGEDDQLRCAVEDRDEVALQHGVAVVVGGQAHGEKARIPEQIEDHQQQNGDQGDQKLRIIRKEAFLFHVSLFLPQWCA